MRVLVTGGGGFLGGGIVRRLVAEGHSVRSYSRNRYAVLESLGVEQVQGDLADRRRVAAACREVDIVFHVAAKAGVWGPERDFYEANVLGTRHVISGCREAGVTRLVYTSSPSVVFNGSDMEGVDESVPYSSHFKAAYPKTKAAAEQLVLAADSSALATVALRPHLIWGPGDTQLVPGLLARHARLKRVGPGGNRADFTFIDNAVEAHICAARVLQPGTLPAGRAYFIAQNEPIPVWEFVDRVLACAGLPPVQGNISRRTAYWVGAVMEVAYRILPLRGEPRLTRFLAEELATAHWFDIRAAMRDLGYQPLVTMEEGFTRLRQALVERGGE